MKKETVSMFDLDAAFKALDEIEVPKVSAKEGFKANRANLKEYFTAKSAHEVLVEDYFDVNDSEDLNAAKEEREAEVAKAKLARIEKIVDLDAESEEDILPSYVGKVIMQCPQCMTLFYKNEEDIEKSEEAPDVVNINEVCQHCGNTSGYTLVGKVGGINEDEAENFDLDGIDIDDNELSLDFPEDGTEEVDAEGTGEGADFMDDEGDLDLDFEEEEAEEEETEEANESLQNSKLLDKIEDKNDLKTDIESEHLTLNEDTELMRGDTSNKEPVDTFDIYIDKSGSIAQANKAAPMINDFKAQHPDAEINVYYFDDFRYSEPLAAAKAGKQIIVYTDDDYRTNCPELADFDNVTLVNIMQENLAEGLNEGADIKDPSVSKILARLKKIADANDIKIGVDNMGSQTELIKKHCSEKECDLLRNVELTDGSVVNMLEEDLADWYRKKFDRPASTATQQAWEDELNGEMGEISDERRKHLERKFAQQRDWENRHPDKVKDVPTLKPIEAEEPAMVESIHNSDLLAKIEDKNDLKTEIESEHLTLREDATDELLDTLWSGKQPTRDETLANLEELREYDPTDDFEEFDEAFDEHVTKYLQEVYSNIKSYTSTGCSACGKKLVVEGLIAFQSGRTKSTKFTFESGRRLNGSAVFRGMNEGLTSEKSAFRLACKTENKKLITENFSYRYTIEGAEIKGNTRK